jgi:hypothetical protein
MGLLDRAFGADKNTLLFRDLAFHWRAVASNYRNHLKNNEVSAEDFENGNKMVDLSEKLADYANESVQGFGFSSPDLNKFSETIGQLLLLEEKVSFKTDKPLWLKECVSATYEILRGNKRPYQRNTRWFSD